jgi:hypothetical protein
MMNSKRYGLTRIRGWTLTLTVAALLSMASIALAQGGEITLSWWTVDNGGGLSQGGDFVLNGTLGQPDAGASMSGGQFSLQGGFWPAGSVSSGPPSSGGQSVYLPLIMR